MKPVRRLGNKNTRLLRHAAEFKLIAPNVKRKKYSALYFASGDSALFTCPKGYFYNRYLYFAGFLFLIRYCVADVAVNSLRRRRHIKSNVSSACGPCTDDDMSAMNIEI